MGKHDELYYILCEHAKKYPLMRPTDAVKLIYQGEFGSGHMIKNEAAALERLKKEYAETERDSSVTLYEYIGCGTTRVNLAAVDTVALPLERLNSLFADAANRSRGTVDGFKMKLETLRRVCEEGKLAFDLNELSEYLFEYEKAGFPPVSHSEQYRKAYKPSYRIILRDAD